MGKGDGCCGTNPSREGYTMDWRENSHNMDELVVKIMQEGKNLHLPGQETNTHIYLSMTSVLTSIYK